MHLEVYNPQPIMLWFAIKEIGHVLMTKYPMNQNMAKSVNKQTCRFGSVFYMHLLQWDAKGFPLPLAWRFVVGWGGGGAFEEWKYRYSLSKSLYEKMASLNTCTIKNNKACTLPLYYKLFISG